MLYRRLIQQGATVHLILRENARTWRIDDLLSQSTVYSSDLNDAPELTKIVKEVKPTVIYHLATNGAYSYQEDANQIIQTNILGTWNLLQACSNVPYRLFVNTGSSSEYGFKNYAMRETDLLEPASYYAVTKSAQTLLCSHIARQEQRPIVTLRPFSVYGPYEEPQRFVPTLMKALLHNETMNLVSPEVARDQIYVDDMVDAYLKIDELAAYPGEYFNIGTGVQSTIRTVVEKAIQVTKQQAQFHWGDMPERKWDSTNWVADISKARRLLNWSPQYTLDDGLRETWKWFKKNDRYY